MLYVSIIYWPYIIWQHQYTQCAGCGFCVDFTPDYNIHTLVIYWNVNYSVFVSCENLASFVCLFSCRMSVMSFSVWHNTKFGVVMHSVNIANSFLSCLSCMLWYSVKPRYLVSETYRHKHLETFCQWCWELCVSVHGVFQKVIDRFEEHYMEGKPWTNEEWLNFGTDMDPWSIFHFFSSARWGIFWHCSVCHLWRDTLPECHRLVMICI